MLSPVCPPVWAKLHAIIAPTNTPVPKGRIPSAVIATASSTKNPQISQYGLIRAMNQPIVSVPIAPPVKPIIRNLANCWIDTPPSSWK